MDKKIDWEAFFNGWHGSPADDTGIVSLEPLISDTQNVKPVSAEPTDVSRIPKPINRLITRSLENNATRGLVGHEQFTRALNLHKTESEDRSSKNKTAPQKIIIKDKQTDRQS